MIGTIYERLAAVTTALIAEGIEASAISIHANPASMRAFAVMFDAKLSAQEIRYGDAEIVNGLELTPQERDAVFGTDADELLVEGRLEQERLVSMEKKQGFAPLYWRSMRVLEDGRLAAGSIHVRVYGAAAVRVPLEGFPQIEASELHPVKGEIERALARISPKATPQAQR